MGTQKDLKVYSGGGDYKVSDGNVDIVCENLKRIMEVQRKAVEERIERQIKEESWR